jgi:cytochrome P450
MPSTHILPHTVSPVSSGRCPVEHTTLSHQKTVQGQHVPERAIECDERGAWHIHSFELVRCILRGGHTRQAGFNAELLARTPRLMRQPILYQDGKTHQEQRRQTARFFAPKMVRQHYREMMEQLADSLVTRLQLAGKADLSQLTLELAVRVAAEVVGLTDSPLPGMPARLDAFFQNELRPFRWTPRELWSFLRVQRRILTFFFLDVRPAIRARRRQPREDLISHLIAQGYSEREILTECVTFAAAGMITTREFISVATWHLLEKPDLRARYLVASEEERYAILGEILRLEPVVGHLYRRAATDLRLEYQGQSYVIPQGALIDLHIHSANVDPQIVGEQPLLLCPGRELNEGRVSPELMSFGDGPHRCPGSYIATQETDILLQRLLALDGLRIERQPDLTWNKLVTGYELRKFLITLH